MAASKRISRLLFGLVCLLSSASSFQQPRGESSRFSRDSSLRTPTQLNVAAATTLNALNIVCQSSPYAVGAIVCGLKSATADWIAQKRQMRNQQQLFRTHPPNTDMKQNLAFTLYGAFYLGITQEYVYNHVYPVLFGATTSWGTVLRKVCFDLCIQSTLVTLPIAYLAKALIFRYSAKEAFRRYQKDIFQHGLLKKYCMVWGPVQCITFSIIPVHLRVSFTAFISFFWMLILSNISSKHKHVPKLVALPQGALRDARSMAK